MSAAEPVAAEKPDCIPPPAGSAVTGAHTEPRVASGTIWRGMYEVGDALGEAAGRWYAARQPGSQMEFCLRVSSAAMAADRDQVWPTLCALDSPHLQKPVEAHTGSERVEVWHSPSGSTLRDWRHGRPPPNTEEIHRFVQQMTTALELLHSQGLGHFGLRLECIHAQTDADGLQFCLAGFDAVARVAQQELIPIAVDVLHAPPEAAGLFKHTPGELLLAWDWWSLGRVLQELILGQHVLQLAPPELSSTPPRSRLQLAESLLLERDVGALRAGGVELMPTLHSDTALLLRGLLTSAKEGRWGAVEVREWLAGKKPAEHYAQPRQQRFFRLGGRGCTPPEAARILSGPGHAAEVISHVFGAEDPGRLAHYLHETRAKHNFNDLLEQAVKLTQANGLKGFPPAMTREIAAAIALMAISGGEFYWRGQPLAQALTEMLEKSPDITATTTLLRAFGQPVVLELIKHYDATAGGRLENLIGSASEAEMLLNRCCISRDNPAQDLRRLWLHALEPTTRLNALLDELRRACACTTHPALEKIFSAPHPNRGMLVLLAWTSTSPKRYGYLTHAEVKARKLEELQARGHALAQLLFWLRLERALQAGPLLFGSRWPFLGGGISLVLLLAVHVPGPAGLALGLVPFVLLAALRFGLNRWQALLVRTWTQVPPWQWRHGIFRCQTEARTLASEHGFPLNLTAAGTLLKSINTEITTISRPDTAPTVPWPPRHQSAWLAVGLSWAVFATLAAGSIWRGIQHPPSWKAHAVAWQQTVHPKEEPKVVAPKDQKQTWPYKLQVNSPFPPMEIKTVDLFEPTPAQFKAALVRARELLQSYKPESVDAMIAVFVPQEDGRDGLLFYEGKKRTLMTGKGVIVEFMPMPKQWLKLGEQYMVYLGK